MRKFILILLGLVISGCATTQKYLLPKDINSADLATLYVYRTDTYFHSLNPEKPFIYFNDRVIAKLGTGQSAVIKIPKGKHRLSVRQPTLFMPSYESNAFEHNFEAGQNYYVRYSLDFGGWAFFSLTNKESYVARK
ncbi:MAG TPA: hypothetical protein DCR13_04695 [Gammaproteobacteria bacterium]|nr:hypothetical protein [Gammaproteobacteria bacterium]